MSRRTFGYLSDPDDYNSIEGSSQLKIKLVCGTNLAKKDIFGASDPYVRIDLITINGDVVVDTVLSKTKKKTLNPEWDEEFVFRVKPSEHKIVLQVFDENRFTRDDFLGMVELTLVHIPKEQEGRVIPVKSYPLRPRRSVGAKSKVRGTLEIYHAYIRDLDENSPIVENSEWENIIENGGGEAPVTTNIFNNSTDAETTLPENWEERQDANGRTFYVNHIERTAQWDQPTLASASAGREANPLIEEIRRRFQINDVEDNISYDDNIRMNSTPSPFHYNFHVEEAAVLNPEQGMDVDGIDRAGDDDALSVSSSELAINFNDQNISFAVPALNSLVDGGNSSINSESGMTEDNSRSGSMTSINALSQRNDSSRASLTSQTSTNLPVRPAPAIPHALDANRRMIDAQNRSNSTTSFENVDTEEEPSTPPPPQPPPRNTAASISPTATSENFNNLDSSEEPVITREIEEVDAAAPEPPTTPARSSQTPTSQTNSTASTSSSSSQSPTTSQADPSAGLPPGWDIQVAPTGRLFFIDHNEKKTSWVDPRTGSPSPIPSVAKVERRSEDDLGPLPAGWEERIHEDGRIFYINHNDRTTQWDDPRLLNPKIAGQAVPYSRDYKQKYEYFKSQLKKPTNVPNKFEIKIRRTSILEDSYRIISSVTKTDLLKTKLWIEFEGETGLDYGGLAREWFYLLSKEMFNPYYGLFEYSAMDKYTLQINPFSGLCNEEHINYFKFIGRIAGTAVYHGKLLDAFFIRPFYKMMLQKPILLRDMESVDMEYYNSLLWIKENDPSELMLTFSIDEDSFGHTRQRELKPNGANIDVTNENKDEYIRLVIEWRFVARVKEQMTSFLEGFGSIVPLSLLKIFDENELELLMCGIQNIDVKDWKQNTLYKGDYHAHHIVVQWFWRAVLSFSDEMRSRLLQFVTGTSRVPMNGFKELYGSNGPQMFTIEKWGTPENYPRAHTCFNRLDLPPYVSYLQLKDKLIKAIEGSQGFAGVD